MWILDWRHGPRLGQIATGLVALVSMNRVVKHGGKRLTDTRRFQRV